MPAGAVRDDARGGAGFEATKSITPPGCCLLDRDWMLNLSQCGWVACRTVQERSDVRVPERTAARFFAKQLRRDRDVSFEIAAHEVRIGPRGRDTHACLRSSAHE